MVCRQCYSIFYVIIFMVFTVLLGFAPLDANAQSSENAVSGNAATSQQLTPNNISKLVSGLNSEEFDVLSKLLRILSTDKVAKKLVSESETKSSLEKVEIIWQGYSTFMWKNINALPAAITIGYQALLQSVTGRGLSGNLQFLLNVILALSAGAVVEFITRKILQQKKNASSSNSEKFVQHSPSNLAKGGVINVVTLVIFTIGALLATRVLFSNLDDRFLTSSFILYIVLVIRIMKMFMEYVLAPNNAAIRPVSTDNWNARFIYRNFLILTVFIAVAFYLLRVIQHFQIGEARPFTFWVGQIILASILYVTWRARHGVSAIIRGDEEVLTPGLERMAAWWPIVSMIVITLQFVILHLIQSSGSIQSSAAANITTIMLIVFAPFFDTFLRGMISRFLPKMQGEGEVAEVALFETKCSYVRISRVLLVTFLLLIIGKLWGIDFKNLAQLGFGGEIAKKGSGFLLTLAIGYLAWELTNLWVNRLLAKETPSTDVAVSEEGGGAAKSRLATVLPLISMTIQISIILLTVLLGLGQLGVNITPLLAGAGVFGLAIGFGAQALVKDVVSGVFFLLDDAFRVGDFIEIDGIMGTVEKISIRSFQLRHPNGPVHVIPYGEIKILTNNSRDYVILKLRFTVPFDTDLEKVRKLFKKIGQKMMENPEHAENFIQPFKFQGVVDVDDVGIVVRGKFSTKPGAQWMIRKEIYARVQQTFDENGIKFARREVVVQMPGRDQNSDLSPDQVQAVATAAAVSVAAISENSAPKKDEPF